MNKPELKQIIKEEIHKVLNEITVNNPNNTPEDVKEYLIYNLEVYLEGDMEGNAYYDKFTLEKDEHGDPELYDDADMFHKTVKALKSGDIKFISWEEYGYEAVASLKGENILIRFKEIE